MVALRPIPPTKCTLRSHSIAPGMLALVSKRFFFPAGHCHCRLWSATDRRPRPGWRRRVRHSRSAVCAAHATCARACAQAHVRFFASGRLRPALTSFLFTHQDVPVGATTFVGAFGLGLADERLLGRHRRRAPPWTLEAPAARLGVDAQAAKDRKGTYCGADVSRTSRTLDRSKRRALCGGGVHGADARKRHRRRTPALPLG
jgi:hypothetical protein